MMDFLARQTWESAMGNLFKEASEQFKARRKAIDDHHKALAAEQKLADRERKAAERQAKKAEAEAEKAKMRAERIAMRARGRGGRITHAHGRGRGRGRGRGQGGVERTMLVEDIDSDGSEMQMSDSGSTSTDHEDVQIPDVQPERRLPRACRAKAPRFLASDAEDEEDAPQITRPRPRPRPIPVRRVPAPEGNSSTSDMRIALSNNDTPSQTQSEHGDVHPGAETVLFGAERVTEIPTDTTIQPMSECRTTGIGGSHSTRSGRNGSKNAAGPSTAVLRGEVSTALVAGENVITANGVQLRRSRRLMTK